MTVIRTMALGTMTAAFVAGLTWAPRPAAGQQPTAPTAAAGPITPIPDVPSPPEPAPPSLFQPGHAQGMIVGSRNSQTQSQIAQLAQQYVKSTNDVEKKDLRKKLSDALGKQFDQLAERQQKELEELEKQVASLKSLLKKRHDNRESIVDRRLEQVLQDAEGLGWGTPSAAPRGMGSFSGSSSGFGGAGGFGGSGLPERR